MLLEYGKRVEGVRIGIVGEESVPGMIYEVDCNTYIQDRSKLTQENVERVRQELWDRFRAKLIYLGVDGDKTIMQVEGSPFSWGGFMTALPTILQIIGLVLLGVSIVAIIRSVPWWQLFIFVLGLILFLGLAEKLMNLFKSVAEGGE